MSSNLLVDTYKRYKAGTNKLINWLVHASTQAHYRISPVRNYSAHEGTSTVAVDQLVTMAQAIVKATDPLVEIPIDILDVTKDTINGRRAACDMYANFASKHLGSLRDRILDANNGHRHFLKALEKVFDILRVEFRKRQPKRKKKFELAADTADFANLYQHLELQEISEDGEDRPDDSQVGQTAEATAYTESVELEGDFGPDSEEERYFALWCHLMDLWELRIRTREVWQLYAKGDVSFFVACQTFDKAVRIADNLGGEFCREQGACCFNSVLSWFGDAYPVAARSNQLKATPTQAKMVDAHGDDNQCEFLLMPAWCAINDFAMVGEHLSGKLGVPSKTAVPSMIFPMHPFAKALMQLAGDIGNFIPSEGRQCCTLHANESERGKVMVRNLADKYTNMLIECIKDGEVVPGLLAATSMYSDLYDILDGDLCRGVRESIMVLENVKTTAETLRSFYLAQADYIRPTIWHGFIKRMEIIQSIIRTDRWEDGREGWVVTANSDVSSMIEGEQSAFIPLHIMATLPVFASHLVGLVQYQIQELGMAMCTDNQVVLSAAHLYRAARLQGSLTRDWRDMSALIVRENEVDRFVRAGDDTVRGVAVGYCLALGVSLVDVAGAHRPPLPSHKAVYRDAFQLTNLTHFVLVVGKHKHNSNHSCLSTCERNHLAFFRPKLTMNELYTAVDNYSKTAGIKDSILAKQWQDTKRVSGSQLVQLMHEIFVADDWYLNFNLIDFYQRCFNLQCRMIETYYASGRQKPVYRKNHKKSEVRRTYEMTYDILWKAAGAEYRGRYHEDTDLYKLGQIMDGIVASDGEVGMLQASALSSGTIPDSLRPSELYGPLAIASAPRVCPPALRVRDASGTQQTSFVAADSGQDLSEEFKAKIWEQLIQSSDSSLVPDTAVGLLEGVKREDREPVLAKIAEKARAGIWFVEPNEAIAGG